MRLKVLAAAVSTLTLAAACGAEGQNAPTAPGQPVESRAANGAGQTPAFAGQTRAPSVRTERALNHSVVASGLEHPWGLALLP
ncbi:MAG TPA: PQQ-dependent sugar dehydrogenase, partial [Brevundimonas sp.]|nr:PQQ-dependent sugar dehydrogenase [Brevundimonas sp.]